MTRTSPTLGWKELEDAATRLWKIKAKLDVEIEDDDDEE
jgi:hypothetical protein